MLIFEIERLRVHKGHIIFQSLKMLHIFINLDSLAIEHASKFIQDGASTFLFFHQIEEHAQHIVTTFQKHKINDRNSFKYKHIWSLCFNVFAYLSEIIGFIHKFLVIYFLLALYLLLGSVCCEIAQFEHLAHRVRLPDKENLQYLL